MEKARIETRRRGHSIVEKTLADESILPTVAVGGGTRPWVVEIIVGPKGEMPVKTRGFAGSGCREASRFVEEALGRRTAETLTPDYNRDGTIETEQRQSPERRITAR